MAAGASNAQPQPNGACRLSPIKHGFDSELLLISPSFGVRQRLPMKGGGQHLLRSCRWKQVPRQLLNGEAVERQIVIEGLDHPVAITPSIRSWPVFLIPVTVRIAGHVQPVSAPTFAKVLGGQSGIHDPLIGIRRRISYEVLHLSGSGRQA